MLYQLYDLGKVKSLDDPFIDYCPQFSLLNPFTLDDTVTLRYCILLCTAYGSAF